MATLGDWIFLGICVLLGVAIWQGVTRGGASARESVRKQQEALKKAGYNFEDGKLSLKTDRVAPSRDEYIDRSRQAFARAGEAIDEHRHGISWGASTSTSAGDSAAGAGARPSVPTRRTAEDVFGKAHHHH